MKACPAIVRDLRAQSAVGAVLSLVVLALALQPWWSLELGLTEAVAVVSYAWSVWLLARNKPLGWWVGLLGVVLYGVIFYEVRLFAEVGIQAFYFVTSLQAIYIWLRWGADRTERPVGRVPPRVFTGILAIGLVATLGLRELLIALRGAEPFWDALTTVFSITAHLLLMGRFVQSWYLWIAVDTVYVPLYASRGLYFTSALYAVFLLMAVGGLLNFRRIHREQGADS